MLRDPILMFAGGLIAGSLVTGTIVLTMASAETREAQAAAKEALEENRALKLDQTTTRQAARFAALMAEAHGGTGARPAAVPPDVAIDAALSEVRGEQARVRADQARAQAAQAAQATRWSQDIAALEAAAAALPSDHPQRGEITRTVAEMRARLDRLRAPATP